MKYIILLGLSTIIFNGCATKLTTEGNKTRQIEASSKNSCVYLGSDEVEGMFKFGDSGNRLTVLNEMRNITALKGGNAYMTNDFRSDGMGHYSASFEIFKCPVAKEEYMLPKKYLELEKLKELLNKGIITQQEYEIEKNKLLNYQ